MKNELKGSLLVILAMLIFGSMGIVVRIVPASTITLLFFMQLFASAALFFLLVRRKELAKAKHARALIALAVVAVLNDLFYFNAFRLTTISNAILTHYTAPVFVALLAPFLIKEKLEKSTLAALAISFLGLFLILYSGLSASTSLLGMMFGVGSGIFYALLIIIYKHVLRGMSVFQMMFYRYAISAFMLLPFLVIEQPVLDLPVLGLLFLFSMLYSAAASLIHAYGIGKVKAQHAAVLGYLEPVTGTAYALVLLSEVPTLFTLAGGALIVLGGYIVMRSK